MAGSLYATIKPRPIEDIVIGTLEYRIPAYTADVWLDALTGDDPDSDIVPGMLTSVGDHYSDPADEIEDHLMFGEATAAQYEELVREIIDIAAGRPWWIAIRLISIANSEEMSDYVRGQIVLHRLDATRVSLAAWLDAVYAIVTTGLTQESRQRFDVQLSTPPPTVRDTRMSRARKRAAFEAIMNS